MPTTRGERPCRVGIGPREGGCLYARGRFGVRTQASKRPHVGLFQRNHVGTSTRRRDQADGGLGTPSAGFASVTDTPWLCFGGFSAAVSRFHLPHRYALRRPWTARYRGVGRRGAQKR